MFFLDLPPEMRDMVYSQALVFQEPIGLSPYSEQDVEIPQNSSWKPRLEAVKVYRQNVKPALKALRVSRQLNKEASPVFYGQNEFRFTAVWRWYILYRFLRTISKLRRRRSVPSSTCPIRWYRISLA